MFLRNEVQHCQSNALENSKASELIIPPHTFKRNCQWYLQCKVRSEFSSHHKCLLWELIPSLENLSPLVNKFREKCGIAIQKSFFLEYKWLSEVVALTADDGTE
jgi:hypothetical protein